MNPMISGHCHATQPLVIEHRGDVSSVWSRAKAIRRGGFTKRRSRRPPPRSSDEHPLSINTDTIGFEAIISRRQSTFEVNPGEYAGRIYSEGFSC
jgi:hypothetical protein